MQVGPPVWGTTLHAADFLRPNLVLQFRVLRVRQRMGLGGHHHHNFAIIGSNKWYCCRYPKIFLIISLDFSQIKNS